MAWEQGATGKTSATASLDSPSRAARLPAQAGTKETAAGTNKGKARNDDLSMTQQSGFTRRGLRENETKWRIGLPGACEHW